MTTKYDIRPDDNNNCIVCSDNKSCSFIINHNQAGCLYNQPTDKFDIRRSIDEGRPVAEDETDGLSAARGIINGLAITLVIGFLIWAGWMIFK